MKSSSFGLGLTVGWKTNIQKLYPLPAPSQCQSHHFSLYFITENVLQNAGNGMFEIIDLNIFGGTNCPQTP